MARDICSELVIATQRLHRTLGCIHTLSNAIVKTEDRLGICRRLLLDESQEDGRPVAPWILEARAEAALSEPELALAADDWRRELSAALQQRDRLVGSVIHELNCLEDFLA